MVVPKRAVTTAYHRPLPLGEGLPLASEETRIRELRAHQDFIGRLSRAGSASQPFTGILPAPRTGHHCHPRRPCTSFTNPDPLGDSSHPVQTPPRHRGLLPPPAQQRSSLCRWLHLDFPWAFSSGSVWSGQKKAHPAPSRGHRGKAHSLQVLLDLGGTVPMLGTESEASLQGASLCERDTVPITWALEETSSHAAFSEPVTINPRFLF